MNSKIEKFLSGVHNLADDEIIPKDSAQDSQNWLTEDGKIILSYGKNLVGQEGGVGKIYGEHFGYKVDGSKVHYRKIGTKIQYLNGSTWTDIITGLSTVDCTFANYSSLAGSFTFIGSSDGLYKINNANPASYVSLYNSTKNDKGKIMIDKGRLIMWDCVNASKTTLKLSWIDAQDGSVYTTVTGESVGALGSITYTGTLAFKAGGATRNSFAPVFNGTVAAGSESFTDNKDGTLTSNRGGTGTINYTTGSYSITFSAITTGAVTADYQWEDSTNKGLADFTYSSTRVASEGNKITQDIGGDKIVSVLVGQDGAYYSLKEQSSYKLDISADDLTFTNLVYRRDIGIPFFRAASSTSKGIVFINTANPSKPELTILQRNTLGDNIEPVILFPHFKFSDFNYNDCFIDTWDKYIIISCSYNATNDRILLCNITKGTVDITTYGARTSAKDTGNLYIGSPLSENIYQLFNGFDDDGTTIDNYWIGRGETYGSEILKKVRRLRLSGLIQPSQKLEVYLDYDDSGFELVGTILGNGSYVDIGTPTDIGNNLIGDAQIGGNDNTEIAYPFRMELKIKTPKFRKRTLKLVAKNIGYIEMREITDWDIFLFEDRIPKRFRQKSI